MKALVIRIPVDGLEQLREAYYEREIVDLDTDPNGERLRLRPYLNRGEHLRETVNGYMEIVTRPTSL